MYGIMPLKYVKKQKQNYDKRLFDNRLFVCYSTNDLNYN